MREDYLRYYAIRLAEKKQKNDYKMNENILEIIILSKK